MTFTRFWRVDSVHAHAYILLAQFWHQLIHPSYLMWIFEVPSFQKN
jgi:hypothetical protein